LVTDDGQQFSGTVEIDEALIGGRVKGGKRGWGAENKTCLFGMKQRGGNIKVIAVKNRERDTLFPIIRLNVAKGTMINTDEFKTYHTLSDEGYGHKSVVHSKYQWAQGETHTNSIEGYWANLKKSILGTHTYVSPKHIQKYLAEFDFRHNHRDGAIFEELLKKIYGKTK
jgi:transposase-like protein